MTARPVLALGPDISNPNIGGRNRVTSTLRAAYSRIAACWLRVGARHLAAGQASEVMANGIGAVAIGATGPAVFNHDRHLTLAVEELDFTELHAFADRFEAVALAAGYERHGVSLAKIHEIRWIWPIAYAAGFGAMTKDRIATREAARFVAMGPTKFLPAALAAADEAGLAVGPGTRALECVSLALERFQHRRFLGRMVDHYVGSDREHSARSALGGRLGSTPAASDRPTLLVIGNFDRTIERFEKLWPTLERAGWAAHVLALPRICRRMALSDLGVDHSILPDWVSEADVARIRSEGRSLGRYVRAAIHRDEGLRTAKVAGLRAMRFASPALDAHLDIGTAGGLLAVEITKRVIDALTPAAILSFEDWDFNRAADLIGRSRAIPSIGYYCLSAPAVGSLVRRTHDRLAVSGAHLRQVFLSQYAPDAVTVVGDPLVRPEERLQFDRPGMRKSLGLKADRSLILLLLSYPAQGLTLADIETYVRRAAEAAHNLDAQLVAKAHPAQTVEEIRGWFANWGLADVQIVRDVVLIDYCLAADVVVAPITTAVHQAMISGAPVVSLQSAESLRPFETMGYEYLAAKGVVHVPPGTDATPVIESLMREGPARDAQIAKGHAYVVDHVGPRDGLAAARFGDLLARMIPAVVRPSEATLAR